MYGAIQTWQEGDERRFGSWYEAPEWMLADATSMLPRLEAEESLRLVEALLAASQRLIKDSDQRAYLSRLERQARGGQKPKAPAFTGDFLRRAGALVNEEKPRLLGPDGRPVGEEVT